jgi:hypothetical protein
MICHIEASSTSWDDPITLITAECGARGIVFDDGEIMPEDFDFVLPPDPNHQCDCGPCLDALAAARTKAKRESVPA